MELTREILLERRASLEAAVLHLADGIEQTKEELRSAERDLHANRGAIQQIDWTLAQLDAEE